MLDITTMVQTLPWLVGEAEVPPDFDPVSNYLADVETARLINRAFRTVSDLPNLSPDDPIPAFATDGLQEVNADGLYGIRRAHEDGAFILSVMQSSKPGASLDVARVEFGEARAPGEDQISDDIELIRNWSKRFAADNTLRYPRVPYDMPNVLLPHNALYKQLSLEGGTTTLDVLVPDIDRLTRRATRGQTLIVLNELVQFSEVIPESVEALEATHQDCIFLTVTEWPSFLGVQQPVLQYGGSDTTRMVDWWLKTKGYDENHKPHDNFCVVLLLDDKRRPIRAAVISTERII